MEADPGAEAAGMPVLISGGVKVDVRTLAAPWAANPSNARPRARERYVSNSETGWCWDDDVDEERSVDISRGERRRMRDWRVRYVDEIDR